MTTAAQYGMVTPAGTDEITNGDDAITQNANATALALDAIKALTNPKRNLTISDRVDDWRENGQFPCLSAATASAVGMPGSPSAGDFYHHKVGSAGTQYWITAAPSQEFWFRSLYANGTVWGTWEHLNAKRPEYQLRSLRTAPASGFKVAAQSFTTGHGGSQTTGSGFERVLGTLTPHAVRGRICIANRNPRYTTADSPAVALPAVTIGIHTAGGAQNTVTTVALNASTGTTGYKSPVIDLAPYAGKDILIGYDWSSAGTVQNNIGTGYGGAGTGAAGTGAATLHTTLPLFVWLEVEVPNRCPIVSNLDNSLGAAVGAARPLYDSYLSQYARRIGAVPMHFAHSGDSAGNYVPDSGKWNIFGPNIAAADMVIIGNLRNDIFGGIGLPEAKARFLSIADSARNRISPNVYAVTTPPTTGVTGAAEDVRRSFNAWLKTGESGARHVYDFAAAVSADDENLTPAYDADGIHLNAAGYTVQTDLLTAKPPVPADPNTAQDSRLAVLETAKVTVDNTVGRRAFAWDLANNRQQMIYGDTGLRDVSALDPDREVGTYNLRRFGNVVTLTAVLVKRLTAGTTTIAGMIPAGFRPDSTQVFVSLSIAPGTNEFRVGVSTAGNYSVSSYVVGQYTQYSITWTTSNAWPTTLPGTAVGTPS